MHNSLRRRARRWRAGPVTVRYSGEQKVRAAQNRSHIAAGSGCLTKQLHIVLLSALEAGLARWPRRGRTRHAMVRFLCHRLIGCILTQRQPYGETRGHSEPKLSRASVLRESDDADSVLEHRGHLSGSLLSPHVGRNTWPSECDGGSLLVVCVSSGCVALLYERSIALVTPRTSIYGVFQLGTLSTFLITWCHPRPANEAELFSTQ